jgi:hypothetical protein
MRPRQVDGAIPLGGSRRGYDSPVSPRGSRAPRFDAKSIGEEVERARVRLKIPVDAPGESPLWKRAGLANRTHWYAKVRGDKPFQWDEVGKLAAEFQAPKGWPIVPWDEGLAWDRYLEGEGQ